MRVSSRQSTRSARARISRGLRGVLALAVLLAVVAVPAPGSVASAKPKLSVTVSQTTGLINQVVQVSWSGFPKKGGIFIYQCKADPKSFDDCYHVPAGANESSGNGYTDPAAQGSGSAAFEVRPAAQLPDLGCGPTVDCSLLVGSITSPWPTDGGTPPRSVLVPLTFGNTPSDCPQLANLDVRTEGEAAAGNAMYLWKVLRCTGPTRCRSTTRRPARSARSRICCTGSSTSR